MIYVTKYRMISNAPNVNVYIELSDGRVFEISHTLDETDGVILTPTDYVSMIY